MDLSQTIKLDLRELLREAEKAYQVKLDCGVFWLPKSQCRIVSNKVYIPQWLADKNGIEYLDIDVE